MCTYASGIYTSNPPVAYSCALGYFSLNITDFDFQQYGNDLVVRDFPGSAIFMSGALDASNLTDFFATETIPGSTEVIYTLVGSFLDTDNWSGTFHIDFTPEGGIGNCVNQSISVSGIRQ